MSDARAAVYASELERCISTTVKLAESIDADKRYVQAREGKAHPAWLLGHLASSLDNNVGVWVLNGDRMLPKGWGRPFAPDFAGGNPITENTDEYPIWGDILGVYKKIGAACVEGVRALTTEELDGDLHGNVPDQFRAIFGNVEATISTMIRHDSHHRGQMAMLAGKGGPGA